MSSFKEIYGIAAARKGGSAALEARLSFPRTPEKLRATPDDRWLSSMARSLFEAGFNWKVIEAKWAGFEDAFAGFNVKRVAFYHGEDLERLLSDKRIVRNGAKIDAVIANARFLKEIAKENGSSGAFFAAWPAADFVGLLDLLETRGARLGGLTGQRALRRLGVDSFVLSSDVVARLMAEDVVSKMPSSKRDMTAVGEAFNNWVNQSGRSLTQISQVLAASIDAA
jgi:3-methyladenine DNA glycosylase Tag